MVVQVKSYYNLFLKGIMNCPIKLLIQNPRGVISDTEGLHKDSQLGPKPGINKLPERPQTTRM